MIDEVALSGGAMSNAVVRVGDTVRRPPGPRAELARHVLVHLERAGFDAAPRWLGVDDRGRDILTWLEGATLTDRNRLHPYAGTTFGDEPVAAALRLLRRYHDTFDSEVVCHGDFGPWNIVWLEDLPAAVIDFDNVHAGDASEDVAYALRTFLNYGNGGAELVHRTQRALQAYGAELDAPAILTLELDRAEERCRRSGWDEQLARIPAERAWLEHHAPALRS